MKGPPKNPSQEVFVGPNADPHKVFGRLLGSPKKLVNGEDQWLYNPNMHHLQVSYNLLILTSDPNFQQDIQVGQHLFSLILVAPQESWSAISSKFWQMRPLKSDSVVVPFGIRWD